MDMDARIARVARWLGLFIDPDDFTELRGIGKHKTQSQGFSGEDLADMARLALEWESWATGVYFVPNPLVGLLRSGQAARDVDVIRRSWLLVDVDPIRPAGTSST